MLVDQAEIRARFSWDEIQALRTPNARRTGRRQLFDAVFFNSVSYGHVLNMHLVKRGWELEPKWRPDRIREARAFASVFAYGDFIPPKGALETEGQIDMTLDAIHATRLDRILGSLAEDEKTLVLTRLGLRGKGHFSQEHTGIALGISRWAVARRERSLAQKIRNLPNEIVRMPRSTEVDYYLRYTRSQ